MLEGLEYTVNRVTDVTNCAVADGLQWLPLLIAATAPARIETDMINRLLLVERILGNVVVLRLAVSI